jgi:hypothetical protein
MTTSIITQGSINMNSIHLLLGTAALIGSAALAAAASPEVVDVVGQRAPLATHDQKAVDACAKAFLAKIAPGSTFNSHAAAPGQTKAMSILQPYMIAELHMEARTGEHDVLAKATCTVNYDAYVTRLNVQVAQPSVLARTGAAKIQLVSRL